MRSRKPAHLAIVRVEDFIRAQVIRAVVDRAGWRGSRSSKGPGRLRRSGSTCCVAGPAATSGAEGAGRCGAVRSHACYRCNARTIAPGSPLLADHPNTVNVRENFIARAINGWVGELFAPDKRDETVSASMTGKW